MDSVWRVIDLVVSVDILVTVVLVPRSSRFERGFEGLDGPKFKNRHAI